MTQPITRRSLTMRAIGAAIAAVAGLPRLLWAMSAPPWESLPASPQPKQPKPLAECQRYVLCWLCTEMEFRRLPPMLVGTKYAGRIHDSVEFNVTYIEPIVARGRMSDTGKWTEWRLLLSCQWVAQRSSVQMCIDDTGELVSLPWDKPVLQMQMGYTEERVLEGGDEMLAYLRDEWQNIHSINGPCQPRYELDPADGIWKPKL